MSKGSYYHILLGWEQGYFAILLHRKKKWSFDSICTIYFILFFICIRILFMPCEINIFRTAAKFCVYNWSQTKWIPCLELILLLKNPVDSSSPPISLCCIKSAHNPICSIFSEHHPSHCSLKAHVARNWERQTRKYSLLVIINPK